LLFNAGPTRRFTVRRRRWRDAIRGEQQSEQGNCEDSTTTQTRFCSHSRHYDADEYDEDCNELGRAEAERPRKAIIFGSEELDDETLDARRGRDQP
jgi:hypothetical protein